MSRIRIRTTEKELDIWMRQCRDLFLFIIIFFVFIFVTTIICSTICWSTSDRSSRIWFTSRSFWITLIRDENISRLRSIKIYLLHHRHFQHHLLRHNRHQIRPLHRSHHRHQHPKQRSNNDLLRLTFVLSVYVIIIVVVIFRTMIIAIFMIQNIVIDRCLTIGTISSGFQCLQFTWTDIFQISFTFCTWKIGSIEISWNPSIDLSYLW